MRLGRCCDDNGSSRTSFQKCVNWLLFFFFLSFLRFCTGNCSERRRESGKKREREEIRSTGQLLSLAFHRLEEEEEEEEPWMSFLLSGPPEERQKSSRKEEGKKNPCTRCYLKIRRSPQLCIEIIFFCP